MRILLIFTLLTFTGVSSITVTGFSGGNVIIYCNYDKEQRSNETFFCMEENSGNGQVNITDTKNTWYQSGRFSLYGNTEKNYFMVVIRNLTRQDEGTYMCGVDNCVKTDSYTKVKLKVKEDECCKKSVTVTAYLGGEATIICNYPEDHEDSTKYLIREDKGYTILSMDNSELGRYSVIEKTTERSYTVTISNLTEDDKGIYWCGLETGREKRFAIMTTQVVLHVTRTPVIIMVRVISVVVLLIVIILIIVYRWKYKKTGSVSSTQRGNTGLENNYEGCHGNSDYELIKEQPLQSDPGIAIYSMVNFPRNPSDSLHYASVNFNKNLGKEATVALSKDDTSSCQYATVKLCQSST